MKAGFSRKSIEDASFDYYFIRNVSRLLSQDINILDALTEVNGWSGDIGLELAKYKIRKFYTTNHEIPTNYQLPSISTAIKKGRWNKFDISTWNQMLNLSIGMVNTKSNGYYVGKSGLDNATAEAKEFYDLHNRLPYSTELITIKTKIVEGYWKDFGIDTWNDFLTYVFDDININRQDLSSFRGKSGLDKVVQLIKSHYIKFGEIPSNRDFSSFDYLARNGIWKKFGIKSWNDLLYYAIGKVNQVKNKYSSTSSILF